MATLKREPHFIPEPKLPTGQHEMTTNFGDTSLELQKTIGRIDLSDLDHHKPHDHGARNEWALVRQQAGFIMSLMRAPGGEGNPEHWLLPNETAIDALRSAEELESFVAKFHEKVPKDANWRPLLNEIRGILARAFPYAWSVASVGAASPTKVDYRLNALQVRYEELQIFANTLKNNLDKILDNFQPELEKVKKFVVEGQKASDDISKIRNSIDEHQAATSESCLAARRSQEQAAKAAQAIAVSTSSAHFGEVAQNAKRASWWWLACSGISLFLLFFLAYQALHGGRPFNVNPPDMDLVAPGAKSTMGFRLAGQMFGRILLLGGAVTLLTICVKNYFAALHNATVNLQRSVALESFQAVVDGTTDRHTRDLLLLQVGQCLYAHLDSGYNKSGAPPGDAGTAVIDFISKAGSGGK